MRPTRSYPVRFCLGAWLLLAAPASAQVTYTWTSGLFTSITPSAPPANTILAADTLVIATTALHDFNATSWTNQGNVQWTGGVLRAGSGATVTNAGVWTDTAAGTMNNDYGGGWTLFNTATGTYHKVSAGTTQILSGVTFHNAGLVNVTNGTLSIEGGAILSSGTLSAGAGATINLASNISASGTVTFGGAGTVQLTGGTFGAGATLQGALTWLAGNFNGTGTTTFGASSLLTLESVGVHDFNSRTLVNLGTVNWANGSIRAGGGAVFTNQGIFNDSASNALNNDYGGGWTFVNTATGNYTKTGAGTTTFAGGVGLNNAGLVHASAGTLQLQGGGNLTGGTLSAGNGAFIDVASSFVVNGSTTFTSAGTGAVRFTAGTISGTPTLLGALQWTSGNFNGGGTTTFGPGSVITATTTADHDFNQRTLVNQGTVNWTAGSLRAGGGAVFSNQSVFHDAASAAMFNAYGGGWTFSNTAAGTYNKTTAGATTVAGGVAFDNAGQVNVSAGTLTLQGGGNLAGGTLSATNGAFIDLASSLVANGTVTLASASGGAVRFTAGTFGGTTTFQGPLTWLAGNFNGAGTTTFGSGSVLTIAPGAVHDFNQRTLVNLGTMNWTGGEIRAGGGAVFSNQAAFNDIAADAMTNAYGGGWIFQNLAGGVYQKTGTGTTTVAGGVAFHNTGLVSVTAGTLVLQGGGNLAGGTLFTGPGAFIDLASDFVINGTATFTTSGTGATRFAAGNISGTTTLAGPLHWTSGNFNGSGTTAFGPTSALLLTGGGVHDFNQRNLVNQGTVTWSSGDLRAGGSATFTNQGTFGVVAANTMNNAYGGGWTFANAAAGTFHLDASGTTTVAGGVGFTNAGVLLLTRGTLALQGGTTFAPTSQLQYEFNETIVSVDFTSGVDYGLIALSTSLALNGSLQLFTAPAFRASLSGTETFTILTAASLSGAFANIASGARLVTADGNGSFLVSYGAGSPFSANSVVLSSFAPIPEPSTWILLALGGAGTLVAARRRRR